MRRLVSASSWSGPPTRGISTFDVPFDAAPGIAYCLRVIRKPHSPRFVRLSPVDAASLFGADALEPRFPISNNRFVAKQRVAIVGQRGRIDGVPVVGPAAQST